MHALDTRPYQRPAFNQPARGAPPAHGDPMPFDSGLEHQRVAVERGAARVAGQRLTEHLQPAVPLHQMGRLGAVVQKRTGLQLAEVQRSFRTQVSRAAYREHLIGGSEHQRMRAAGAPRALQGYVEVIVVFGEWPGGRHHLDFDGRVLLVEARQPRHQPVKRFAQLTEQDHTVALGRRTQSGGLLADAEQCLADHLRQFTPLLREKHRAIAPAEQLHPDVVLKPADLPTDGGLGDVQLIGGPGETLQARRRLEGQQAGERR